jgi:hypothetical protein
MGTGDRIFRMICNRRSIRLLAGLLLLIAIGCASVRPAANLTDPVPVYLADYGVHSSLFLPTQDGRYVEYAFGDWGYAVENRNKPQDAIGALTVSRSSGFGRMYLDQSTGSAPNPQRKPLSMQTVFADRADVYLLIDRLDVKFEQLAEKYGKPVVNAETAMSWVKDDQHYSWANNCNHLTADALEQLGCKVSGVVVWSNFAVQSPAKKNVESAGLGM